MQKNQLSGQATDQNSKIKSKGMSESKRRQSFLDLLRLKLFFGFPDFPSDLSALVLDGSFFIHITY